MGLKGVERVGNLYQREIKAVGVQHLDVHPLGAKGSRRLQEREGRIDAPHVAVLIAFLTDDGEPLDTGRVDQQDAKTHDPFPF
jgi:hypothetical protein